MSLTLQPNSPQFTVDGVTYAISAYKISGLMTIYEVGLLKNVNGAWQRNGTLYQVADNGEGSVMATVSAYGGIQGLLAQIKVNLRNLLAQLFPGNSQPGGEPTTDAEAWALIQAWVPTLVIDATKRPPTVG